MTARRIQRDQILSVLASITRMAQRTPAFDHRDAFGYLGARLSNDDPELRRAFDAALIALNAHQSVPS